MVGPRRDRPRAPCFEQCESRVALSVQPVAQAVVQTPPGADFALDASSALQRLHQQYELTGAGQSVVVIDSGIAYDHPALGAGFGAGFHVVGGWDFTGENDGDPYDDGPAGFHGTHVAGIIGSQDPDRVGVAPDADLIALRVFDDAGRSDFQWIEQALRWVHEHRNDFAHPITTVNLSIGLMPQSQLKKAERVLDDEFAQLVDDGIFIAVAAGNGYDVDPVPGLSYPAASPWVVPVGSVDAAGRLSDFSRRDPRMLAAPGEEINSTITDYLFDFNGVTDDWYAFSGTSQAAPFVAGAAVLVRQALQRAGYEQIDQAAIYQVLRETADWIPDPAGTAQYARVDLPAAIESILPDVANRHVAATGPAVNASVGLLAQAHDLGPTGFEQLRQVALPSGGQWYRLETRHEGWLTVEARFGRRVDVQLDLFDVTGRWLSRGGPYGGYERIDWNTEARQTYFVHVQGGSVLDQLTVANVATRSSSSGTQITVPAEVSVVEVTRETNWGMVLDGLAYTMPAGAAVDVTLNVGADDLVSLRTAEASPLVYARPDQIDVRGPAGHLRLRGARQVEIEARADQGAQVRLYGSPGHDRFLSRDGKAVLSGPRYRLATQGFTRVYVFAGQGQDVAELYGTAAKEVLVAQHDFARFSGADRLDFVEGFERVYAYAAGGLDRAYLYGSSGDDSLSLCPEFARLASGDRLAYAEGFDQVYATAGAGGLDRAYLHGSAGPDRFWGTLEESTLAGANFLHRAAAFDRVYVYATPGDGDVAYLTSSPGENVLTASSTDVALGNDRFHTGTFGFDRVYVDAAMVGADAARLWASVGDDDRLVLKRKRLPDTEATPSGFSLLVFRPTHAENGGRRSVSNQEPVAAVGG
jgi:subtilisin family serine protease